MLNVVMLSVVMLSVVMLSVIMLSALMLSVIRLNVVMLSVITMSVVVPDKSAAGFCRQAAVWVADRFCSFHLAKNHKIANISTTTKAREKISNDLESFEF